MYFLVSYELIDRNDLNIEQKMCALYLARHFDEAGKAIPIDELDIASKLKISVSEVQLNIDILIEKGVISTNNHVSEMQPGDIRIEKPIFTNLCLDDNKNIEDDTELLKEQINTKIPSNEVPENKAIENEEYLNFIEKLGDAEKIIQDRVANLKLKVRKNNNNNNDNNNNKDITYSRRKSDIKELKKLSANDTPSETDELLELLSEQKLESSPTRKLTNKERTPNINIAFKKASSVYSKTMIKKNQTNETNIDTNEIDE